MQRWGMREVLWGSVLTVALVMSVAWAQAPASAPAKGSWSGSSLPSRPWAGIPTFPGCRAAVACSISGRLWNTSSGSTVTTGSVHSRTG